ncbi:pseudouridine synthase [Limoniibacter endophyticus]|uniref:Pseudouridine synthase n=1 Tax=Limoniibacter endophyticus TaxID=1565040 RepID=A0A8J3DHQ3_9HYPH|nr:pseudouridine synthase [Limoniibacter endophyticus]GHC67870.1 pseudouridine synthase [Limoniibacter endophyticus]
MTNNPNKNIEKAAPEQAADEGERIAKRLARAGVSSRREAEALIAAGRVAVNGKVLESPAINVKADDKITVDGTPIPQIERTRLFLFHKPGGYVTTTRDPEGRPTIFDVLPAELPRLMTVGRLDINTEGLLLLTNDGGLSRMLELPTTGWLRRYRVRVHGKVDEKALVELKNGIAVDGVFYGAIDATLERTQGTNSWLTLGLREGKNREVKNVLGALGLEVTRLIRISFGPFQLGDLDEGAVLEVKGRALRDQLGERLIEESGANFDAAINKPFSNKPVRAERSGSRDHAREEYQPTPARTSLPEEEEGGLIRRRRMSKEEVREQMLSRLSTRRGDDRGGRSFGDKPFGKKDFGKKAGRRDEEPIDEKNPLKRRGNVWMAPGARPQGEKAEKKREEQRSEGFRDRARDERSFGDKKPHGERRPYGEKPRFEKREGERKFSGERKPYGDAGERRPYGDKPRFEKRDGERKFSGERKPYGDKPRFEKREGDAGERKPYGDKPRFEKRDGDAGERRPYGDKPRFEKREGERKFSGERKPYGDKPRFEKRDGDAGERRPYGDKPRFEKRDGERKFSGERKPYGDKPRSEGFRDRPRGERPFGDKKPSGNKKSFGDKPRSEKRDGVKRDGDKPGGERKGRDADRRR